MFIGCGPVRCGERSYGCVTAVVHAVVGPHGRTLARCPHSVTTTKVTSLQHTCVCVPLTLHNSLPNDNICIYLFILLSFI